MSLIRSLRARRAPFMILGMLLSLLRLVSTLALTKLLSRMMMFYMLKLLPQKGSLRDRTEVWTCPDPNVVSFLELTRENPVFTEAGAITSTAVLIRRTTRSSICENIWNRSKMIFDFLKINQILKINKIAFAVGVFVLYLLSAPGLFGNSITHHNKTFRKRRDMSAATAGGLSLPIKEN